MSRGVVVVRAGVTQLVRCPDCGSWTYLPLLTAEAQAALHDTLEYHDHPYFAARRASETAPRRGFHEAFGRIAHGVDLRSLRGERILDVGCDTGVFLEAAAARFGIIPVGIDVSSRAIQEARRRGFEAYHTTLETAPEHLTNLALITAIDLIEHVADPRRLLQEASLRLRPGGLIYVETPNNHSMVYRMGCLVFGLTGGRPRGAFDRLFPNQHAHYFTRSSLTRLAQACGFEIVRLDTRPIPFREIGTVWPIRLAVTALQLADMIVTSNHILICALLRRPE